MPALLALSAIFPSAVRVTAGALAYNVAQSLFGGTGPFIGVWLNDTTGSPYGFGVYLAVLALVTVVGSIVGRRVSTAGLLIARHTRRVGPTVVRRHTGWRTRHERHLRGHRDRPGLPGRSTRHGGLGWSSVTLLRGTDRLVLVDSGSFGMRPMLAGRLREHGVDPADVTDVLLSHAHYDHAANYLLFPAAAVHIGADELAWAQATGAAFIPLPELYAKDLAENSRTRRIQPGPDGRAEVLPGITAVARPWAHAGQPGVPGERRRRSRPVHRRRREEPRRAVVRRRRHDARPRRQQGHARDDPRPVARAPRHRRRPGARRAHDLAGGERRARSTPEFGRRGSRRGSATTSRAPTTST